jgi:hypothetical protein
LAYGILAADFNKAGGLDLATDNGSTSDVGSASVLLNEPVIALLPSNITFGLQKVGTTSAAQVVTLSNPGATPLKLTSIKISGNFAETNSCPKELAGGGSCTINVSFSPTGTGVRTGTLTSKDSALSSSQVVALSGTGEM